MSSFTRTSPVTDACQSPIYASGNVKTLPAKLKINPYCYNTHE